MLKRYFLKYNEFLNESESGEVILYHGGDVEELDENRPICLSEDYYMAYSYSGSDNKVYSFKLSPDSKILDLTNSDTFKKIKSKIYDNYSEKYLTYNVGGFYKSKDSIQYHYNFLKKFKNFQEIEDRYNNLLTLPEIQEIYSPFTGEFVRNCGEMDELTYENNKKNIDDFYELYFVMKGLEVLNDKTLNEFGTYFQDYCKENGYDGYKANSSYLDGKTRGIEYTIVNLKVLKMI